MKPILGVVLSLLVGVATFLTAFVVATELLAPYVWPALLVSLPVACVAGVAGVGLAFLGLRYRAEKIQHGRATPRTVARLGGFAVGIVAFALAGASATAVLGALGVSLVAAMLVGGFPVGTLVGLVAGYLTGRYLGRREEGDGAEARSAV